MANNEIIYAQLVDMSSPSAVFAEISHLSGLMAGIIDLQRLEMVFAKTCDLYTGKYPGYRACNTHYHDLRHTTDVFLSFARLLHGAHEEGVRLSSHEATMALISTLLHDTGYIQESSDCSGTGGKYTLTHVARSVSFLKGFLPRHGFSSEEVSLCESFVSGTCIRTTIADDDFPTRSAHLLGKMIGTADLLGQLADRIYLEKLLFLYREFREANMTGYSNEMDLLTSTISFYGLMKKRLADELSNVRKFMVTHFRTRWGIDRDLYREAIDRNLEYLQNLLDQHSSDYRDNLKREGLVQKLISIETCERINGQKTTYAP